MQIVTSLASGKELVVAIEKEEYDLVLMDIDLIDSNGYEVVRQLRKLKPNLPIVILSNYTSLNNINAAMHLGVSGYISKNTTVSLLKQTLVTIVSGISCFDGNAQMKIIQESKKENSGTLLSNDELILLKLIHQGYLRKQIAHQLKSNIRTIDHQILKLQNKLGVNSKIGLATYIERWKLG